MKKHFFIIISLFLVLLLCSCFGSTTIDFEQEAKGYYEMLKETETVQSLKSVACLVQKRYDGAEDKEGHIVYGYSFIFLDDGNQYTSYVTEKQAYAYFEDGRLFWVGANFTDDKESSDDKSNAMVAYHAHYSVLNGDMPEFKISRKDADNGKEGIFLLNTKKIK